MSVREREEGGQTSGVQPAPEAPPPSIRPRVDHFHNIGTRREPNRGCGAGLAGPTSESAGGRL